MIKYGLYSELNDDHICEALGCFAEATTKVDVKVGVKGTITLHLCVNCINKFDQKERMLESVHQPYSNTDQSIQPSSMQGVLQQEND
jgi:hypothetical protein